MPLLITRMIMAISESAYYILQRSIQYVLHTSPMVVVSMSHATIKTSKLPRWLEVLC